jgi:hypothetical protein
LTLVIETRYPYELAPVLQALQARSAIERGGKTLHPVRLGSIPGELWCPTDQILVLGFEGKDLDAVPLTPQPGIDHLPSPIQALLRDRLGQSAQALLAADSEQWETKALWLSFALKPVLAKQETTLWSQVQRVGLWLRFDQTIFLNAGFAFPDRTTAEAFHDFLVQKEMANPETVEVRRDVWVTVETQTNGEAVRQALRGGFINLPEDRAK